MARFIRAIHARQTVAVAIVVERDDDVAEGGEGDSPSRRSCSSVEVCVSPRPMAKPLRPS